MLEIINVSKTFSIDGNLENDRHALKHVSLTINDDDFITIIGGNGSGKTTLLNVIAGVYRQDEGQIKIDGVLLDKKPEHKRARYIGRVFQDPTMGTIADMSLIQNLSLANQRGRLPNLRWSQTAKKRNDFSSILKMLDLGLEERLDAQMKTFSGGQRQSITLLMATLHHPRILLLDEHTAALDPKTARKVMQLTNNIVTMKHIPTLMITHNMKDAIKYGNRLIMMREGEIIFEAQNEEKQQLTVEQLIEKFNALSDDELPDSLILG